MNQGQRANKAGRTAEQLISCVLSECGYAFTRQAPIGRSIYGHALRADFLLDPCARFPAGLIIESKWQDVSGSVDEKLPYLVANIRECYPMPTVVVLHGGGIRTGAKEWLERQVDDSLIKVCGLESFVSWLSRNVSTGENSGNQIRKSY